MLPSSAWGPRVGFNEIPGLGLGHSLCGSAGLIDCSTDLEAGGANISRWDAAAQHPHLSSRDPRMIRLCPSMPPHSRVCLFSQQRDFLSNVPLGTVDRHAVVLVPAAVGISGHEAAMAAPAVDPTHVQGDLAHFPLGAHIQLPLEESKAGSGQGPSLSSQPLKRGFCHLGGP